MEDDRMRHLAGKLRHAKLVAIDGLHGVGKSTLARRLSQVLSVPCVHLDDFLLRGHRGFIKSLRWNDLARAIGDSPVLVEGVCVLAVLERLGRTSDALVYVLEASPETRRRLDSGDLAREVAAYHRTYRPRDVATFLYDRRGTESTNGPMRSEEAQVDVAYINSRTRLATVLAIGGMMTLFVGLGILVYGATGGQTQMIKALGMEVSAGGMGAVIMTTSSVWAFFAYKARPQYSRRREMVESFDDQARLTHREERSSSTQAATEHPDREE